MEKLWTMEEIFEDMDNYWAAETDPRVHQLIDRNNEEDEILFVGSRKELFEEANERLQLIYQDEELDFIENWKELNERLSGIGYYVEYQKEK